MSCTQQHHGRRWLGGLLRARLAGVQCRIDLLCLAVADEKDLTCVGIRFRGCFSPLPLGKSPFAKIANSDLPPPAT